MTTFAQYMFTSASSKHRRSLSSACITACIVYGCMAGTAIHAQDPTLTDPVSDRRSDRVSDRVSDRLSDQRSDQRASDISDVLPRGQHLAFLNAQGIPQYAALNLFVIPHDAGLVLGSTEAIDFRTGEMGSAVFIQSEREYICHFYFNGRTVTMSAYLADDGPVWKAGDEYGTVIGFRL